MQTFGSDAPWQFASVQTRSMTLAPIYYFKFTHTPDSDTGLVMIVQVDETLFSLLSWRWYHTYYHHFYRDFLSVLFLISQLLETTTPGTLSAFRACKYHNTCNDVR